MQCDNNKNLFWGVGPLVISHKIQVKLLVNLCTKASYAHSSKSFPGTTDKILHCEKFHSSSCLKIAAMRGSMDPYFLKVDFILPSQFFFFNFAQENGQKIYKHAHKVGRNGQNSLEN